VYELIYHLYNIPIQLFTGLEDDQRHIPLVYVFSIQAISMSIYGREAHKFCSDEIVFNIATAKRQSYLLRKGPDPKIIEILRTDSTGVPLNAVQSFLVVLNAKGRTGLPTLTVH